MLIIDSQFYQFVIELTIVVLVIRVIIASFTIFIVVIYENVNEMLFDVGLEFLEISMQNYNYTHRNRNDPCFSLDRS